MEKNVKYSYISFPLFPYTTYKWISHRKKTTIFPTRLKSPVYNINIVISYKNNNFDIFKVIKKRFS